MTGDFREICTVFSLEQELLLERAEIGLRGGSSGTGGSFLIDELQGLLMIGVSSTNSGSWFS